ncbi:MAG: TonB-dependent receptor [Bacteroidota bacterium]
MYLFRYTLLTLIMFVGARAFAQQPSGSVAGKVADAQGKPVAYATVTLLRADSSVVSGDLSKDDGAFTITAVPAGNFTLRIESIGMATKRVSVQLTDADLIKEVGTIKLDATENTLKTVSITGEKALMEMKVDKKVFNVEKNTTTAGGSATDVLQNVPAVSVEADGTINLRGKSNVTILIDGKPATLLGADITSALQSLPAGSISSVEVITNPSAKYDAQGTTGIINIITKKDGRFGMNGNITLGAGTGDKYNGNLGLNVRKGKWNTFLNSSFRLNRTWNNVITNRVDKQPDAGNITHSYYTYEHVPRTFNGFFNTLGFTYDANEFNSITVTGNVNKMEFAFSDISDYYVYNAPSEPRAYTFHQFRKSGFSGSPFSVSASADYKHKFKKKDEELNVDATFARTTIVRYQDYITTLDAPGTTYSFNPIVQRAPGEGGNNSLTAWADYTNPLFTKNGKLGLGVKTQIFDFYSSNQSLVDSGNTGNWVPNQVLQAGYDYMQQIHAAYINWSDQMGKFSYQLGLRGEDAIYDGTGKVPFDSTFHNSFFNFFPSAFITYQLPAQQSIYLNYSRRTNRPGFMQLLPFVDLSNPSTVSRGNPGLIPEFINNIEFSYNKSTSKGSTFILSAYYAYTQNLTERIIRQLTTAEAATYGVAPSTLFSQPVNIASGATYGLEGSARMQLTKAWDATASANLFRNELVIGDIDPLLNALLSNNSGYVWFAKLNTNYKLPANFSLQVNANYESPKVVTQGNTQESYWIDVALRKNLWKNKATLVLNCSDILRTRVFVTNYNSASNTQTIERVKETRIGNINFTYRFGTSESGKDIAKGKGSRADKSDKRPVKPSDEDRENNLKQKDDDGGGGGGGMQQGGGQRKQGG